MDLCSFYDLPEITREVMSRNEMTLRQITVELRENCRLTRRIESAIPNDLGFPLACDHKPLLLEDALGRRIPFPYEFAVNWEVRGRTEHREGMLVLTSRDIPRCSMIS